MLKPFMIIWCRRPKNQSLLLKYTDCKSCFACKLRGNKTNGICAIRDDLRPVLEKIHEANAVIIGSPIYYGNLTGETASMIGMIFGSCELLYAGDTYQFSDYSKYFAGMFSEPHKAEVRAKQFPKDLQNACELGKKVCS